MTEEEFAKKLLNTLYHFSSRKGWLYIGAWERGGETNRLHFHGLFYIPEGTMSGEMEILRDFDTRKRRMQTVQQNTFFAKKFGRNEFRPINHVSEMPQAVQYLVKYIEKSGGKLIYSRGLYQYFVTDIMDEDIVCPYGLEDRKILLFRQLRVLDRGRIYRAGQPRSDSAASESDIARCRTVKIKARRDGISGRFAKRVSGERPRRRRL